MADWFDKSLAVLYTPPSLYSTCAVFSGLLSPAVYLLAAVFGGGRLSAVAGWPFAKTINTEIAKLGC